MSKPPDPTILQAEPWKALGIADLGPAALVPTMLNIDEQTYYVWLTRDWATGEGAVVDLGSFAGGSAACLAEGVAQSGRNQTVFGFDKYVVDDFDLFRERYERYLAVDPALSCGLVPRPLPMFSGNDLSPLVRFFLEPWGKGFSLCKGQIEEAEWQEGDIEVLVMDASKTAETMDKMSRTFLPHLIPGRSVLVQQDFLWWQQPWIAAQMALLADFFVPVAHVAPGSVSFLCTRRPDPETLARINLAAAEDKAMIKMLREAKKQMKPLGIDRSMRRLIEGVKRNPGIRKAFQMTTRPEI